MLVSLMRGQFKSLSIAQALWHMHGATNGGLVMGTSTRCNEAVVVVAALHHGRCFDQAVAVPERHCKDTDPGGLSPQIWKEFMSRSELVEHGLR